MDQKAMSWKVLPGLQSLPTRSWKCHLTKNRFQAILLLDYDEWVSEECKKVKIEIISRGKLDLSVS